ncbi:hypothetical protein SAMN04487913_104178 [Arthrobacter sp. ok362]|nr:hypothetical protein SAMN04487913_104178 [Arthrobacter sp. ok362]
MFYPGDYEATLIGEYFAGPLLFGPSTPTHQNHFGAYRPKSRGVL